MISFPCHCGKHRFAVDDSEAGGLVQCPRCNRLNDVPTLSDLAALEDDGTLKLAEDLPPSGQSDPARLADFSACMAGRV